MARYYQKDKGEVINLDTGKVAPPEYQPKNINNKFTQGGKLASEKELQKIASWLNPSSYATPSTTPTPTPSASTTTIRKGRPSPRTQGVTASGETFQKFGTQQLDFVGGDPPKIGTPYQGVQQKDTGYGWKQVTTGGKTKGSGLTTVFSERFQAGITGATPTALREEALRRQKEKLADMGLPDIFGGGDIDKHGCECEACKNGTGQCSDKNPKCDAWDLGCELFGEMDKHGCECEACKNGTGQCSDKRPECDAWDLGCELGGGLTDIVSKPAGDWWDKYGIWVYGILAIIGIGVLLWLLRPLFGIAKNVTGISKSAVTKVNGLK